MTYDRTLKTICILYRVVAMIPGCSVLRRVEDIAEAISWCNRTLSDAVDTVHVHGLVLTNTMPVDTGAISLHTVDDGNIERLHGD